MKCIVSDSYIDLKDADGVAFINFQAWLKEWRDWKEGKNVDEQYGPIYGDLKAGSGVAQRTAEL